jgi:hypothetical protein
MRFYAWNIIQSYFEINDFKIKKFLGQEKFIF